MKQSGVCPKCNGTKIWNNAHIPAESTLKRWIPVSGETWSPWKRKYAYKDEYVCIECGYTETHIDEKGLQTIKDNIESQS